MADTTLDRSGRDKPPAQPNTRTLAAKAGVPIVVALFVFSLILPNYFFAGSIRLSPYKLLLLLAFVPVFFKWVSGTAGGIKGVDLLMLFHCMWVVLALLVVHGANRIEAAGLYLIETFGVFLLARVYIRTPQDYAFFIKCLCWAVVILLPLGLVETLTSQNVTSKIMSIFSPVYANVPKAPRMGLDRVQGPFEHPILFGVFCATVAAPSFFVWARNKSRFQRSFRTFLMGVGTFISLSVGAYISFFIQIAIMFWDYFTVKLPRRWLILSIVFISMYILIDLLSNRTPVEVFISYLTFNSGNSFNRVLIWQYGTAEVARYPLFGIGFNDWTRAYWMSTSMDNFWLVTAVRYGIPAFLLLMTAFLVCVFKTGAVSLKEGSDANAYRTSYIISISGFILALCTVHVWNANYVLLIFCLGSGVWIMDYDSSQDEEEALPDAEADGEEKPRRSRYSRAPVKPAPRASAQIKSSRAPSGTQKTKRVSAKPAQSRVGPVRKNLTKRRPPKA